MIETIYYLVLNVINLKRKKKLWLRCHRPTTNFLLSFLDLWYLKPKISTSIHMKLMYKKLN